MPTLNSGQPCKIRQDIDQAEGPFFLIGFAVEMMQAVGKHQVFNLQDHIIPDGLVQFILRQLNIGGFAFHHEQGCAVAVKDRHIKPFSGLDQLNFGFNPDQRCRDFLVDDQVMKDMLPYPFFRGQPDMLLPDRVKNGGFSFLLKDTEFIPGKIQRIVLNVHQGKNSNYLYLKCTVLVAGKTLNLQQIRTA